MTSPTQAPAPTKGSWEALLVKANQLDENRNEEALEIYAKLIRRLQKMPERQLQDHGQRLQRIYETACVRSANLNASLERFEDSLDNLKTLHDILEEPDDQASVCQAQIRTLQMMNRDDDALAILADQPVPEDAPLSNRFQEFGIYLDALRLDDADKLTDELQSIMHDSAYQGARAPSDLDSDLAQLHSMKSISALERENWKAGIEEYQKAQAYSEAFEGEGAYLLYSNLVHRGQSELALPIIEEEPLEVRRKFWSGLAHFSMGKTEEATQYWEEVTRTEISEDEAQAYIDLVLTHFYLGDKQRIGLELILRMLNEMESPSWHLLYFAAVGWGLRDNETNMLVNLDHAIDIYRRHAYGRYLPWTLWPTIQDLFSPEMQDKAKAYFSADNLKHYFGI